DMRGDRRRRRPSGWRYSSRSAKLLWRTSPAGLDPMGYGVIGSPTGSGPVSLGSSPGTPAACPEYGWLPSSTVVLGRLVTEQGCTWPRRLAAQDAALSRR